MDSCRRSVMNGSKTRLRKECNMKKLTKKEKIMIGTSIAVGTGLAILGIKQQNKIKQKGDSNE